jgi:hypothetical protein
MSDAGAYQDPSGSRLVLLASALTGEFAGIVVSAWECRDGKTPLQWRSGWGSSTGQLLTCWHG